MGPCHCHMGETGTIDQKKSRSKWDLICSNSASNIKRFDGVKLICNSANEYCKLQKSGMKSASASEICKVVYLGSAKGIHCEFFELG